jgi:hypothetical protein
MDDFSDFIGGCIAVIVVVAIVGFFALLPFVRLSSTGRGAHTGYITAVEQKGFFFKNYNVYVKTDNQSSQEDVYCLDRSKTDLASKLQQFSKNRELVSVTFQGVRGFGLGLCSGEQIIDATKDQQ